MTDNPFPIMILFRPEYVRDVHAARRAYPPNGEAHLLTACNTVVADLPSERTVVQGIDQPTCERCLLALKRIEDAT